MKYEELISTITEIVENDKINKNGLILLYELPESELRGLNELLFYMDEGNKGLEFQPEDAFEVEMWGILIKFRKKT